MPNNPQKITGDMPYAPKFTPMLNVLEFGAGKRQLDGLIRCNAECPRLDGGQHNITVIVLPQLSFRTCKPADHQAKK